MIDYKTLKHSDNGMPTWDGWYYPLLLVASRKETWKIKELVKAVLEEVPLPTELSELRYTSKYHDLVAPDRISWAKSDLKIAGFLQSPKRGVYEITDAGREALKKYGSSLSIEIIHQVPAYLEHQRKVEEGKNSRSQKEVVSEEQVEIWVNNQEAQFKDKLLNKMRTVDPYDFEHMMMELLNAMGYRGTNGKSLVTQKSNDGGIDGIINQDALGLQTISIQVKRYGADNVVGRPEIDAFHGAVDRQKTNSGVFITTSSFTQNARKAAKDFSIALVDGEMLTNLMIQYQVGVQSKKKFELYQIDNEFFSRNN